MQCLYCGKTLGLMRELSESEFCSGEHQRQYKRLTKLAFSRLFDAHAEATQPELAGGTARRESLFLRPAPPKFGFTDGPALRSSGVDSSQPQASPALMKAGASVLHLPPPAPVGISSSLDRSSLRPTFGGTAVLAFPSRVLESPSAGPALQAALQSPLPVLAAPPRTFLSVQVQPVAFRMSWAGKLPASLQLRTVDLPLIALPGVLSSKPILDPIHTQLQPVDVAGTCLRAAGSVETAFGGRPALPTLSRDSGCSSGLPLCHSLPRIPAALAHQAMAVGVAGNLPFASHTVLPVAAAVPLCALAKPSLAPMELQEVAAAGQMLAEAQPLAYSAPAIRRLNLQIAADKLTLRAEEKMTEEFTGADLLAVPLSASVSPNLEPASALPALASLFRLGGGERAVAPLPHLSDRLEPLDRLRLPVAFMEVPMPAQRPVVPRCSSLRIVETFEYLRPLEEQPLDIVQNLLSFWQAVPGYLRYATASAAILLLFWLGAPADGMSNVLLSRWSRLQSGIRERAAVEMSEDFQGGMAGWQGQGDWTRSWQINKAGYARPGRLALYQPSMQMQDYRMEFLVQIEKQAVSWAYRASDVENYYAAKITVVKPGPLPVLSLVRYPVIGGRQGEKVEIPIRILMHNNTPYRVQLTVNGQEFSTSIEGQVVDFWRDDRLKTGGFGFFSDSGERARVYWMRLAHQDDFVGRVCAYFGPMDVDKRRDSRSF